MSTKYRNVLESDIEGPVVKHARKRGIISRKMNGLGFRSWPDRLFLIPMGRVLWIEFKKPGGEQTELQKEASRRMEDVGHPVYVIDNVAAGVKLIDDFFDGILK